MHKDKAVLTCVHHDLQVSLQFSPTEAVPGEENTLQLSALPGSLCGLSAVDQSVFIMEPGKRLNTNELKFRFIEYLINAGFCF